MKTLANRIDLGVTRIAGYNLFCSESREFQETTPREVKALINQGQVNGLKLINGHMELDTDGFNMHNLKIKSACGRFRTLYPADNMVNMYAVVRVIETDNGRLYETISNKCARVKVTPERLNMMIEMGYYVAGVKMVDGQISICQGVTILDKRSNNEPPDNQCYPVVPEVQQLSDGDNIEPEPVSLEVGNNGLSDAAGKPDEAVSNAVETPGEKTNSLKTIFDSLDVTKYTSDVIANSDGATITTDYTKENEEVDPSTEQADEKKKVNGKTKKK